ncbi:MAG: GNAT family N-acetyltransferase [Methanoculleus sp.]|uniref:GNAT family N-acetyltransferase n=1 Tax=unclassified Methanoculleus TaxID=2619537 RepID=UPI0026005A75|nr:MULTISPECIES: GNAT family N-acetyltransferase [unclassified Methanoculleus]MCK9317138.1 GNAT family N-acetyltransferase [Methanoculleus sp.]MDD2254611.1 GNAT family N-acetyltransferase [Methanoculleus sp.]MDD3217136.1 GNAT family N-acetyltransferase [Methanoculleus sp.]MDD4314573.1 GNAT family N-acetyltransferase [Methanoculleus sp.]MDD4471386.1 GNAT family N-acetyltransferase [Methanoculleus sp.]
MQSDTPLVREAVSEDLNPVLSLYTHMHDADESADVHTLQAAWEAILADPRTCLFILEHGGVPVSSCVLHILQNLTRGARPYGLIENVVTHREFRNRGFGTALLAHALDRAWGKNCYKVMLLTGRREQNVFRLYEKAGFVRGVKEGLIAYPPPGGW